LLVERASISYYLHTIMARKPEIAELPTRVLMQELGSEKRHKKVFVFGALGVVALGGIAFAVVHVAEGRRTAAREAAFGAVSVCLLGDAALSGGETPAARVASVKLGVIGVSPEKRGGWPQVCAKHAFALSALESKSPLGTAAEALGKQLETDANATQDLGPKVTAFFAEAEKAKVKGAPPADAAKAPKPATVTLSAEAWSGLPKFASGAFRLANIREESAPGGKKLFFLIDEKESPDGALICTAEASETAVKCMKVPAGAAAFSPGLRLIGTTENGARPFYFAGDRGQLGVFPPDAKGTLATTVTYGASSRADGSFAYLSRPEKSKDLQLTYFPATGAPTEQIALRGDELDAPTKAGLFWDWLVWRSPAKAGPPAAAAHLYARKLEAGALGPASDVGELEMSPLAELDRTESHLAACRSDDAIAIRVRAEKGDQVVFFASGRWSAPFTASTKGGAFTCHGLEAISTTIEHSSESDKDFPTVTQAKCNMAGCTTATISMRRVLAGAAEIAPIDPQNVVAADVGGKLLIAWNAGASGGLRMRLAPADQIGDAADVILAAPREEKNGNATSPISQLRAVSANGFAILFMSTSSGVRALRIEPNGKVAPMAGSL
jgi:hypothetical protein